MRSCIAILLPVLFSLVFGNEPIEEFRVVQTNYGAVRGTLNVTIFENRRFYSFKGIPFAKPPLGQLRFKSPKHPNSWTEIRDSFNFGPECIQTAYLQDNVIGNEDCLYLNVYVPDKQFDQKLPVMFFIHGGGYVLGSANGYGSDFLINNDVILVTTNYRLGIFGFMSFGNGEYSGNMGLKDQRLALNWVNENIEFFGGDKSKITIFGESSGAGSVHLQVLSPSTKGLYQRAIVQSGSALNPWAFNRQNNQLKEIRALESKLTNATGRYEDLITFLQTADANVLALETAITLYTPGEARKPADILWSPVVEVSDANDVFLSEHPAHILKRPLDNNADILFGFTSAEMYTLDAPDLLNPDGLKPFNEKFELQLPRNYLKYDYDSEVYRRIANDIRTFYFSKTGGQVDKNSLIEFNTMLSDIWFVYGIIDAARQHSQRSSGKIYIYQFSLDSDLSLMKKMFLTNLNLPGTAHGEDLMYTFRHDITLPGSENDFYHNFNVDSLEQDLIRLTTNLWTNFAKYGTPTSPDDSIKCKPIDDNVIYYVDVTNEGLIPKVNPFQKNIEFWDELYDKYQQLFESIDDGSWRDEL